MLEDLKADLRRDEGLRLTAYPDPLSPLAKALRVKPSMRVAGWAGFSGAPWTIGYGHTGSDVRNGTRWSVPQAEAALDADLAHAWGLCERVIPFWQSLNQTRREVVANMVFNMGWDNPRTPQHEGLSQFVNTLAHMSRGEYAAAAAGMRNSLWYRQTGQRAERLCVLMEHGKR